MVIITASRSTAPSPASSSREASPRTDEYAGDGPFRRDETGRASNACGTVGVSTRGRDAGDARISINTVDNDRLNREYRVFARVVSGMDVVDRIGKVKTDSADRPRVPVRIEKAEVRE